MDSPEVMAKMEQAQAAEAAAKAIEMKAQNGARQQEIQGAYELWQKAQAGLEVAGKTFARVSRLYDEGVIPAQKRDEAEAQLKAMQATEKAAKSQYEMAKEGARREDKAAAAAQVARAKGDDRTAADLLKKALEVNPFLLDNVTGDFQAEGVEQQVKRAYSNMNPFGL
jgi:HlyD family secretion protein